LAEPTPRFATWKASDGYEAHFRHFHCGQTPRAHIIGLHGIQSHGGWYEHSSRRLCSAGYDVYYLDRRGAGLNQQDRGDTPSFRRLIDDIAEFIDSPSGIAKRSSPVILAAVSWGGKPATAFFRRHPKKADGLALLCPGFFPKVRPTWGQRIGILLSRLAQPRRRFPIPLNDPSLFTATPRWQEFIANDELSLREASARLLAESVRLDLYLRWFPPSIEAPVLLMLATEDRIIDNERTRVFVDRIAKGGKQIIEYPGAHHTLEFEADPELFIAELSSWLRKRW
jgi:alpha-beta hydrolase superfamily lysophospholipase